MSEKKTWEAHVVFEGWPIAGEDLEKRVHDCIETHPTLSFRTMSVGVKDVTEGIMKSVIYREARGFNGQPGNIICEIEGDTPPKIGDIIELSKEQLSEKRRHVVETLSKEIYSVDEHKQIVWVAGVTRLYERGRFPIDDEDLDELRNVFEEKGCRHILARVLGDPVSVNANIDELVRELVTRLS